VAVKDILAHASNVTPGSTDVWRQEETRAAMRELVTSSALPIAVGIGALALDVSWRNLA
jgi:hypothetical protein